MTPATSPSTPSGLSPTRARLTNGVVVLARETRKTPIVSINIAIRAGSICDPADAPGTTYLLARSIDRGTATRSAAAIAEELDGRGITLTTMVTRHLVSIVCTCLAEDFEAVLGLIGEIVMAPSFPETEVATRRGEAITAIRQDEDNPAVRAVEGLMSLLYPNGHPYGRPAKGTVPVVERLSRTGLASHHAAYFRPAGLTTVLVGDVDAARMVGAAERTFGGWQLPGLAEPEVPPVDPARERRRLVIPLMNKAQADVAYGFTTITRPDPDYYAFWVLNNALGQYALGGRLGDRIRERQGMAYYVSSALEANVAPGPLVIRAGVSPANVDRAISSIDDELSALVRDGLSDKELQESRQYMIGSLPRALETNAGIAAFLQSAEFFGLGLDYDRRLPDLLRAVTREQVHDLARRWLLPDHATVVVAGPYQ
jgi:zinc protease